MAQSIKKNFIYNVLLNISSVIFPLITAPYVSRVLEPDGVGLFNFSGTYAGYFATVALLGIPTYGVREIAKVRDSKDAMERLFSQLLTISILVTLVVTVIYLASIALVGQLSENFIIFFIAGFVIYLSPFSINWYYQGIEEFGFITLRTLVVRVLSIVSLFIFVRTKEDLIIYVIINVLGIALANIWNYLKLREKGIKPYIIITGLKMHIKPLLILFASSVAVSIYTVLDTLMLGFMTDYEQVGYYTNAMHISKVLVIAVTSLSIVAAPRVSYYLNNHEYQKINELFNTSFSFVCFLAFPITVGLVCASSTFVPLFFGISFVGSVVPLIILSLLIIAIGLNNLAGIQILVGMGFDKEFLYCVLVGTFSNFLLNIVLIPYMGSVGASIASVAAEVLILIVMLIYIYKRTPVRIVQLKDFFTSILGALLLVPVFMGLNIFFEGWSLLMLFLIAGGLIYFGIECLLNNSSSWFFISIVKSKVNNMVLLNNKI